jgi:nitrogen PTS system EIIA component
MRSILNALHEGRLFELPDTDKTRALEFLARILDANPDIEVGTDAIEAVQQREQECNTGIGLGVAVPHVRAQRDEGELFCAIGWSQPGINYGAPDNVPVHLVFMYYIPGAQKNIYLKEVSILVKAIKKSGGIAPIEGAPDLNEVRNLLLDWVSAGLGDTGPEAVARMIKLEVKQAQVIPATASLGPLLAVTPPGKAIAKVMTFTVLVVSGSRSIVLAQEEDWVAAMEKDNQLAQRLATGTPFQNASRQVFVTGATPFPGGRILYQCVALATMT